MIENIGLQDIYLDVSTKLRQKTFYANEVDTKGRGLHAFLQDNGVKVDGTGVTMQFRYKSFNDGESKVYDFTPIGDPTNGEFEIHYPTEMVRGHGNKLFPCTIVARDSTSELAFENVFVYVNKAEVNTEGVEASNEYSALKKSLDDVLVVQEQLGNITPEQITQVTTAETNRVTAESGRATAETTRGNSETSRVSAETGRTTAEGLRVTAESSRVIAEDLRETAEATREANDQARGTYVEAIEANYAPELATVKSQLADVVKGGTNVKFKGKTWNVLGDSITLGGSPGVTKTYHQIIDETYNLMTVNNYGENASEISSGGTFANPMCERYSTMDANVDYITIFGGVNDFLHNVPLGTIESVDNNTFYGALNNICIGLFTNFTNSYNGFITPLPVADDRGEITNGINSIGLRLKDYVTAIIEVCNKHNMPLLDLFNGGGFRPDIIAFRNQYMPDGLHPIDIGHKKLAHIISGFLENIHSYNSVVSKVNNPACRVRNSVVQSIPTSTLTTLSFNTEDFDTDNMHDSTINNSRLTCKTAGIYSISANVGFADNVNGQFRQIRVMLNGTQCIARLVVDKTNIAGAFRGNIQTLYNLNKNDCIEIAVYQDSGIALDVLMEGVETPVLQMVKVG